MRRKLPESVHLSKRQWIKENPGKIFFSLLDSKISFDSIFFWSTTGILDYKACWYIHRDAFHLCGIHTLLDKMHKRYESINEKVLKL